MAKGKQWTRVIVLTPPPPVGAGLNDSLRSLLDARDWFALECHDPALAMAELCLRERAQAARASWGLHRLERIALLVVHAEYWGDDGGIETLYEAVRTYLPQMSIWEADADQLHLVHGDEVRSTADDDEPIHPPLDGMSAAYPRPASKVAPVHSPAPDGTDLKADHADSRRLTRQEINMLLDPTFKMPESEAS